jgi:hypothetical protein
MSWEQSKLKSKYHFDNFKNDSQIDKVTIMGRITADYSDDVLQLISNRSTLTENLKNISQLFALGSCEEKVLIQMPGEVDKLHLDQLNHSPDDPWHVMCIQVALTDWEQGHFWSYGNHIHSQWRAGEVTTYDWQNLPHSTANAGHNPRVTLQLTGIITEKTRDFINRLKRFDEHVLNDKVSSW